MHAASNKAFNASSEKLRARSALYCLSMKKLAEKHKDTLPHSENMDKEVQGMLMMGQRSLLEWAFQSSGQIVHIRSEAPPGNDEKKNKKTESRAPYYWAAATAAAGAGLGYWAQRTRKKMDEESRPKDELEAKKYDSKRTRLGFAKVLGVGLCVAAVAFGVDRWKFQGAGWNKIKRLFSDKDFLDTAGNAFDIIN